MCGMPKESVTIKTEWASGKLYNDYKFFDFIINCRCNIRDICNVCAVPGAKMGNISQFCITKLCVCKKNLMSRVKSPKRRDVDKLKQKYICANITKELLRLCKWETFRDQIYSTGADVLGFWERKHKDWLEDNEPAVSLLLESKKDSFI